MLTYCHFLQKDTTKRNDMQIRSRGNRHKNVLSALCRASCDKFYNKSRTSLPVCCVFETFTHWISLVYPCQCKKKRNYHVTRESHSMTMKAFKHWKFQERTYYYGPPWVARWDLKYSFSLAVGFQLESSFSHWLLQKSSHCSERPSVKLEKRHSI